MTAVRTRRRVLRWALPSAAAAALLLAIGLRTFSTPGEWRAPNGLTFRATDAGRVTGLDGVPAAKIPAMLAIASFMQRTQAQIPAAEGSRE